jgi:hypothetical protein
MLFDRSGNEIYRGAIDNWFFALGKYRNETTEHYLENAIQAMLDSRLPEIRKTEAVGCFIEKK